ncbi:uncharacterized protein LOC111699763 isoform X2 [Eurytemora carolleeae]|uniref:uncharacterized protein LOC111699763 isoform X2 n=1 Tax=Eurytemora carolleeae TaxID=1294199 RepID=UPI000C755F8D|nr:uncharacterized protein LOC111699763 isoform X2 [Eurytemora carolleeae]|eukprot:XP_023326263.1 uncharacterized protein LOC111699763 isoform X2 [Eurytemora affinis]
MMSLQLEAKLPDWLVFLNTWTEIPVHVCLVGSASRFLSHIIDYVLGSSLHNFIVTSFGLTPYLDTFPDFLAGAISMIPAMIVGLGVEGSRSLERMLNLINLVLFFVLVVSSQFNNRMKNQAVDFEKDEFLALLQTSLSNSGLILLCFAGVLSKTTTTTRSTTDTTTTRSEDGKTERRSFHLYHFLVFIIVGTLSFVMPFNRCGDGLYIYFTNSQEKIRLFLSSNFYQF